MNVDEINKFEAESCRIVAIIAGTPAGTLLHQFLTEGTEIDNWFLVKLVIVFCSWRLYIKFMDKARVSIRGGLKNDRRYA